MLAVNLPPTICLLFDADGIHTAGIEKPLDDCCPHYDALVSPTFAFPCVKDEKKCNGCHMRGADHFADADYHAHNYIMWYRACSSCCKMFPTEACLAEHKRHKCKASWKCDDCKCVYGKEERTPDEHKGHCHESQCSNCKEWVND